MNNFLETETIHHRIYQILNTWIISFQYHWNWGMNETILFRLLSKNILKERKPIKIISKEFEFFDFVLDDFFDYSESFSQLPNFILFPFFFLPRRYNSKNNLNVI